MPDPIDQAILKAHKMKPDEFPPIAGPFTRLRVWFAGVLYRALMAPHDEKLRRRVIDAEAASREAVATNLAITKRLKVVEPKMAAAVESARVARIEAEKARSAWAADLALREECLAEAQRAARSAEFFAGMLAGKLKPDELARFKSEAKAIDVEARRKAIRAEVVHGAVAVHPLAPYAHRDTPAGREFARDPNPGGD